MARLRLASDVPDFVREPVGAGVLVETNFLWCASPTLVGSVGWGSPSGKQVERVMSVCDTIFHPSLGPEVDVILDGYRLDEVSPAVAMGIFDWTRRNLQRLFKRIRRQVGVPPPGIGGILLSGLLPSLGETWPYRIVSTPEAAYRFAVGDEAEALLAEINEHVNRFNRVPPLLGELRALLRVHQGNLSLEDAARQLGRSTRTLQRDLEAVTKSSFRDEQARARLQAVAELLATSDDKVMSIAARVGLSATALNRLIRERIGVTVDAWRSRLRGR
jgi:AraC-like DNA-binding protein